jgi:asparagine synthase (glutamine-hydrolysing)
VPLGAFLSGGVDSSSVTAALSKAGCNINTFTIGFEEREFDERPYAREVAQLYGTTHTERVVQPDDVTAAFKKLLFHYDEPFNDYSYLPTYYLCREARQLITVALSGDGGDEVFAGYRKFQRLGMRQDVERLVPRPFRRLLAAGAGAVLSESSPTRRMLHQYGADPAEMFCNMFQLGFSLRTLRTMSRGPLKESLSHYSPMDTVLTLIRKVPAEAGLVNTMRYLDLKLTLAGDMLVKVDRASMAVSLEVRPVYLHRAVVELAAKIPPRLLADRNHSKEVLKSALRAWLPDSILYRKKQGLAMPLKMWFKRELRPMFAHSRSENPLQELLDPALLENLTSQHLCKKADLTSLIHALVFLRHWLEEWTGTRENE